MEKIVSKGYLVDMGRINGEEEHRYLVHSPHLLFPTREMAQFYVDSWHRGQPRQSYPDAKVIKVKVVIDDEND